MSNFNPAEQASLEALSSLKKCIDNNQSFRLEAGAGAGKTFSLIESIRYVIDKKAPVLLQNEQRVACITYTNVAKNEINDRTDNHPVILAETIHAFSWGILQNFQSQLRLLLPNLGEKWQQRIAESTGIEHQKISYDLGFAKITDLEITLHHDDVIALMSQMLTFPKFQKLLRHNFPIIFIDEYQDTDADLAKSIVQNLIDNNSGIMVGLFGDHWQKIYDSGCGLISSENESITEIGKGANFRSDKNIVECLNRMRPDLPQAESNPESQGTIKIFHSNDWVGNRRNGSGGGHWTGDLPEESTKAYLSRVKELMTNEGWDFSDSSSKILFLTNNLIATEQNFKSLADCFRYPEDYLKKGDRFIAFFLEVIEPAIRAFEKRQYGQLFQAINKKHPQLASQKDKSAWIESIKDLEECRLSKTIGDVLDLLRQTTLPRLPERLNKLEEKYHTLIENDEREVEDEKFVQKHGKFRSQPYQALINLEAYIDNKTPFSTKHGVKGAQFDNVLVVLGRGWNKYNWNEMLEWMQTGPPADKQSKFENNRNLFYVSCSRAKHNLTVLFTQYLSENALGELSRIFTEDNIAVVEL